MLCTLQLSLLLIYEINETSCNSGLSLAIEDVSSVGTYACHPSPICNTSLDCGSRHNHNTFYCQNGVLNTTAQYKNIYVYILITFSQNDHSRFVYAELFSNGRRYAPGHRVIPRFTFKSVSWGGMSSSTVTNNGQSCTRIRPTFTLNIPDAMLMPWNGSPAQPETVQHSATFLSGSSGWNKSTSSPFAQAPWAHRQRGHGERSARLKLLKKQSFLAEFKVNIPRGCCKSYIWCIFWRHWRPVAVQGHHGF